MYIGRFVVLGKTSADEWYLGYRVSSRSFPNRLIRILADRAMVVPTSDAPSTDNPYISYNCLRRNGDIWVLGNGSQVDPIIDKVSLGYGLRDALALSLLALDYEHDQYNTPRVVAALDRDADSGYLGIVADNQLSVREMAVEPGEALLIATYEATQPTSVHLVGDDAATLCDALFTCEYELPVAALVVHFGNEVDIASRSARE